MRRFHVLKDMDDPVDPIPTTIPPASETGAKSPTTGLPSNVAAALACIPLIGGIVFYILEKRDAFVRFYAMQSIIFGGAWCLFVFAWNIAHSLLSPIPFVGWLFALILWTFWAVVNIIAIILWGIATVKALSGTRWEIPYLGRIARQQAGDATV
ncbi:MAG: hypothetical protein ABI871_00170 [Chthoniobacterales bacterium]